MLVVVQIRTQIRGSRCPLWVNRGQTVYAMLAEEVSPKSGMIKPNGLLQSSDADIRERQINTGGKSSRSEQPL